MSHDADSLPVTPALPYADAPAPRSNGALAGTAIVLGGLALIGLGGCFLIGVLAVVSPNMFAGTNAPAQKLPLTGPEVSLMIFLYLLAFACFAGAVVLLFLGVRGLVRLLRT